MEDAPIGADGGDQDESVDVREDSNWWAGDIAKEFILATKGVEEDVITYAGNEEEDLCVPAGEDSNLEAEGVA